MPKLISSQERSQLHAERDALERRITELWSKAVEHLGRTKATVRLSALHALARLAQDNPGHRQTTIDVLCGFLRMPFVPPDRATVGTRGRHP